MKAAPRQGLHVPKTDYWSSHMIELVFVACLAGSPDECRERSLVFTDVTPLQCLMGAQLKLAKWVETHPNERIRSWRCQTISFAERDA